MIPERGPSKKRRRCWLKASPTTRYVTLRSSIGWFLGHWSPRFGGCVRCPGPDCPICESGLDPIAFTYAFVELEDGEVMVFEFPERLRELVMDIDSSPTRGVGCQVAIRREGPHRNSAISALVTGFEAVEEIDLQPFLSTLGKPGWHQSIQENSALQQDRTVS